MMILNFIIGVSTGIISGFGIGGGSLLVLYLTAVNGMAQYTAGGINLLYFLPAGLLALPSHVKNGYVEKAALVPAIAAGLGCAGLTAWLATGLEVGVLRKCFGGFLVLVGLWELFGKRKQSAD